MTDGIRGIMIIILFALLFHGWVRSRWPKPPR